MRLLKNDLALAERKARSAVKRENGSNQRRQITSNLAPEALNHPLHLDYVKPRWSFSEEVELIELKQAKPYDEATSLLKNLRDLAEHQGRLPEFTQHFERIKSDYQNRPALIARFKTIKV